MQTNEQSPNQTLATPPSQPINAPLAESALNKKKPWLLITLVILLLGTTGAFAYKYYEAEQQLDEEESQVQPIQSPNSQSASVKKPYTENTDIPNQKKYVNPKLGISFLYLAIDAYDNKTEFTTKEIGNKVYIYPEGHWYESGEYVEVFEKSTDETLDRTIKTTFLENYSEENCSVSMEELSQDYPASYVKAGIHLVGVFSDLLEMSIAARECPRIYTVYGGPAYFLMDQNHSDKFVFFRTGTTIFADTNDLMWQDTIVFLD